jgi:ubiquinone/menaquinone biosynthesis C-methylase UbiE
MTSGADVKPEPGGGARPVYTIGTNAAEQDRLRRQAQSIQPWAVAILDRVDIQPGSRVVDFGCGNGGLLELLSERVGPSGHVLGLDYGDEHVASARSLVLDSALPNVEVLQGDARRTELPSDSFDGAHARLLLINIPRPEEVLAEMVRVVKPGAWVACQEADLLGLAHPAHPACDRLSQLYAETYRTDGANPHVGRGVAGLLRDAGLVDVGVELKADAFPLGHAWRTVLLEIVSCLTPKILERGLADERELVDIHRAAQAHLADPRTVVTPFMMFLAWGRKPR